MLLCIAKSRDNVVHLFLEMDEASRCLLESMREGGPRRSRASQPVVYKNTEQRINTLLWKYFNTVYSE